MKKLSILFLITIALGIASCTSDFTDINKNPNAITKEEASARYFITNPQYRLFAPDRYPYWRAHLIHTDRFAGHFCFGHNGSWWSDELGYAYSGGYTDAAWGWLEGYFSGLDNFLKLTDVGGDFENEKMYAVGLILKGLYYQMFTDVFGEIPYSEAGVEGIVLPKFDTQKDIYQGIIADLDAAMATIGDATTTGNGLQDLGSNDLYFNGDLQKWKQLANSLKLRLAMRAYGADGASFAETAITEALSDPLLEEDALLVKDDEISQWGAACYGDIWHNFGGLGSKWTVGKDLIDYLRENNDPRLALYAKPAEGGVLKMDVKTDDPETTENEEELFNKRIAFIEQTLTDAGADFTSTTANDTVKIEMPANTYYVGQPVRVNGQTYDYMKTGFFSMPADLVTSAKNSGQPMYPEIVFSAAEVHFLKAEAIVKGIATGDEQTEYEAGITKAMLLWGADQAAIDAYIASEDMALLNGTTDENLEKIAVQRWIAAYTDGFEAWAIVRDTGYPAGLADGVDDFDIYGVGDTNGKYPQRMRYGTGAYSTNGDNLNVAIGRQGADLMDTKLWWAK